MAQHAPSPFAELEGLELGFQYLSGRDRQGVNMLVISAAGVFPKGSAGNDHGKALAAYTLQGLVYFDPVVLILDFSGLHYTWGNSLLQVYQAAHQWLEAETEPEEPLHPLLTILGPHCEAAWRSLVTPVGKEPPPYFTSLEKAETEGIRLGSAWLDF